MNDTAYSDTATFCCVQCRLLQPPTTACVECGAPMTAPVELVRELLHYRDMRILDPRDWGLITSASVLTMIPVTILFFVFQRQFVATSLAGALKE